MKGMLSTLIAGAALALFTSSAFADDLVPPHWRGASRSTFQEWEFLTANTYAFPVLSVNPYGTPFALIADHAWIAADTAPNPDRLGIVSLSGLMVFYVPNTPDPIPPKDVWVQVTWRPTLPPYSPVPSPEPQLALTDSSGTTFSLAPVSTLPLTDGWSLSVFEGHIAFNPPYEVVGITGDIDVDQVVIDTICPEPQTYALLAGLGLLGFGVWRRVRS